MEYLQCPSVGAKISAIVMIVISGVAIDFFGESKGRFDRRAPDEIQGGSPPPRTLEKILKIPKACLRKTNNFSQFSQNAYFRGFLVFHCFSIKIFVENLGKCSFWGWGAKPPPITKKSLRKISETSVEKLATYY